MSRIFGVRSGGGVLHGEKAGQGECVVLLHAGVADHRMWDTTLSYLAIDHLAVAYDRRGYGDTTTPDEVFSHVDDLDRVRDEIGAERVSLVGCSQGGRVAIDYALAHPERVGSLILVASAISGAEPPEHYPAEIETLLNNLESAEADHDLARVNDIEAHLWLDGPLSAEGRVTGAVRELFLDMNSKALGHTPLTRERSPRSAMERLAEINVPSLIVWGDLDFPHIQERSQAMTRTIPGAEAVVMRGCAHLPNLEQPTHFNELIGRFLRKHSPS